MRRMEFGGCYSMPAEAGGTGPVTCLGRLAVSARDFQSQQRLALGAEMGSTLADEDALDWRATRRAWLAVAMEHP